MILSYLARHTDFGSLLKFISPQLFKVVPPQTILTVFQQLKKNHSTPAPWAALVDERKKALATRQWSVTILPSPDEAEPAPVLNSVDRNQGETVLKLFFAQVLGRQPWILDFRRKAFRKGPESLLIWAPQPIYAFPEPGFGAAIASLYDGFYGENDALFKESAARLGLSGAESALKDHFSGAQVGLVGFKLVRFQQTFAAIFEHCAKNNIALAPDFFILGLSLLGLYEHLESSSCTYDVNHCYHEAKQQPPTGA